MRKRPSPFGLWLPQARTWGGWSMQKLADLSGVRRLQMQFVDSGQTQMPRHATRIRLSENKRVSTLGFKKAFLIAFSSFIALAISQVACRAKPSEAACNALDYKLDTAVSSFQQACTADSDCVVEQATVTRNGNACLAFYCGVVVAQSTFADFQHFLATDSNVTAACNAVLDSGCTVTLSNVPSCPALDPVCAGEACTSSF